MERDVGVFLQVTRPRYLAVCGLVRTPPGGRRRDTTDRGVEAAFNEPQTVIKGCQWRPR